MAAARSVRTEYDLGLPVNSSVIEALKRNYLNPFFLCIIYLSTATERFCLAKHNPTTRIHLQGHFAECKLWCSQNTGCRLLYFIVHSATSLLWQRPDWRIRRDLW